MWNKVLDLLYPPVCEFCDTALDAAESLCAPCQDSLLRITAPFCQKCSEPFDGNITDSFDCPNCFGIEFHFDFARSALRSAEKTRELILNFKYQRRFYLARELSTLIHQTLSEDPRLSDLPSDTVIIPVPLHWWREQKRTSNQSFEIARQLGLAVGYPVIKAIKRQRYTITQTRLTRKQRLQNLKGAFLLREKHLPDIKGRTILLIDDVFTTGSTAHECAKLLKSEGNAAKVIVLTALRG